MEANRDAALKGLAELAGPSASVPLPEQIASLDKAFARYALHASECPFDIGDLITPRPDSFYPHAGLPHKVLEIMVDTEPVWADVHAGTMRDGALLNIRVGVWYNGSMHAFWAESWQFEWLHKPDAPN